MIVDQLSLPFSPAFSTLAQPRDHHFGRLHDRHRVVTPPQLEGANGVGCDDRRQHLTADPKADLREQAIDPNLLDESAQAIASAQLDDGVVLTGAWRGAAGRPLPREQPVDLRFGDTMMAALGTRRTGRGRPGTQRLKVE